MGWTKRVEPRVTGIAVHSYQPGMTIGLDKIEMDEVVESDVLICDGVGCTHEAKAVEGSWVEVKLVGQRPFYFHSLACLREELKPPYDGHEPDACPRCHGTHGKSRPSGLRVPIEYVTLCDCPCHPDMYASEE